MKGTKQVMLDVCVVCLFFWRTLCEQKRTGFLRLETPIRMFNTKIAMQRARVGGVTVSGA